MSPPGLRCDKFALPGAAAGLPGTAPIGRIVQPSLPPMHPDTAALPPAATDPDRQRAELITLMPGIELVLIRALGVEEGRDASQEVLARACAAIARGRPIHGPLGAFVYGIAQHVIADSRASVRDAELDDDALAAPGPDALEALITNEERDAMLRAVDRLDPEERELLRRCFVNGETTAAVASDLGEPASRIRKRKSRALERLRGLLNAVRPPRHTPRGDGTNRS